MAKEQKLRYSDEELQLIKDTFAENDDLLKVVRKVLLQMPLTEREEEAQFRYFKDNKVIQDILYKCFLPQLDGDAPLNQLVDLLFTVQVMDRSPEDAARFIDAKELEIQYLSQQLAELCSVAKDQKIKMSELLAHIEDKDQRFVNFLARNSLIRHVEQHLMELKILAGQKNETPEQTLSRIQKNSNK